MIGNRYLYTAREYDPETGLCYYRARYYDPSIGRFLQTDPIGYYGGINLYTYVGNNPVNWRDPWGLDIDWSKVAAGAAGGVAWGWGKTGTWAGAGWGAAFGAGGALVNEMVNDYWDDILPPEDYPPSILDDDIEEGYEDATVEEESYEGKQGP